ncbi:MAG: helix-turn-helix transcriptional regulator [Actinomycetales bacterium]|nr:helix-turn-helix transcriptional regulator [Actinomycetales bacterium]
MTILDTAGAVRRSRGLRQAVVAARAGEAAPNLSTIESGRRAPTAVKLDRILRASDARLAAVPTTRDGAFETSTAIRSALGAGDTRRAFRAWLALNDSFRAEGPVNRVVLAAFPPERTGSRLYDAAIAALTELRLREVDAPIPSWALETTPLSAPEIFAGSPYVRTVDDRRTPDEFRRRGVLIDPSLLESA